MMKKSDLVLTLGQRHILLLCIFLICFLLTSAAAWLLGRLLNGNPIAAMRISTVLQDVLVFIVPAVVTAMLVTRRPAELLCIAKAPKAGTCILIAMILIVSVPMQEAIIYWNYHIQFPEFMQGFAETARRMEDAANGAMKMLLSDTSTGALIVNILIIGVFAGLSEELLFRGCFQRLLVTGGVNKHLAVWLVAFFFSALHFQLFGFVPRMLLGAYFGYLLLWTRSLWAPVLAHTFNNTLYVVTAWYQTRTSGLDGLDSEPELWSWWLTSAGTVMTIAGLYLLWQTARKALPKEF